MFYFSNDLTQPKYVFELSQNNKSKKQKNKNVLSVTEEDEIRSCHWVFA